MSTPTPAKKFMLLQDIHTMDLSAKAGTMGEVKGAGNNPQVWFDNGRFYFWLSQVKASPLWFREVEEPVVEKEIIGTGRVYSGRIEGIKEGFEAARELDFGGKIEGYMGRGIKYKTAADYISSLSAPTHNSIGEDKKEEVEWRVGEQVAIEIEVDDKQVPWLGYIQSCFYRDKKAIIEYAHPRLYKQVWMELHFSELKIPTPKEEKKEPFQWTDELVIAFCSTIPTYYNTRPDYRSFINRFKHLNNQSKQH